jgi:O-antigen ligase
MMLFCFSLPVWPRMAVWTIVLSFLSWLLHGRFRQKAALLFRPIPLLLIGFYLLYLLGLTYTEYLDRARWILETKLALLIFPLLWLSIPTPALIFRQRLIYSYLAGCLIATFICFGNALLIFLDTGETPFFYLDLTAPLGLHPTYLAMYLGFGIFLLAGGWIGSQEFDRLRLPAWIVVTVMVWWLLFVFLLAARMEIVVVLLLLGISFLTWMVKKGQALKGGLMMVAGGVILGGVLWLLPVTKNRLQRAISAVMAPDQQETTPNPRLYLWDAAFEIIAQHPWIGIGTGDVQPALNEEYERKGYTEPLARQQNAHNQYLQTTLALGLPGLIWLLMLFILPLLLAFRKKHFLVVLFFLLFALSALTESMLETQRGTLFFGFFASFLLALLQKKEGPETTAIKK